MIKETERLTRLINDVLDLAKIESGSAEWHAVPLDLRLVGLDTEEAQRAQFGQMLAHHKALLAASCSRWAISGSRLNLPMPARLSRHYYDLYELIRTGVAAQAEVRHDLLQRVVEHKSLFSNPLGRNTVKPRKHNYESPRRNFGSSPCARTTERCARCFSKSRQCLRK